MNKHYNYLLATVMMAMLSLSAQAQTNFDELFGTQQIVSIQANGAQDVLAADLDADGDSDIVASSFGAVVWYENDGQGNFGEQQVITTRVSDAFAVYITDLDGDGDLDVISASRDVDRDVLPPTPYDSQIAWYENDGTGNFGEQRVIILDTQQRFSDLSAADLDGDGDQDVLSTSFSNIAVWYENDGEGNFGGQQIITTQVEDIVAIYATDLDGDGDQDVLSASLSDDKIAWYENDGTGNFGAQVIIDLVDFANDIYPADLDGDGDQDVVATFSTALVWYENDGKGNFRGQQVIFSQANDTFFNPDGVYATDLDGDGDQDVLSASSFGNGIAWYENDGQGNFGGRRIITTEVAGLNAITTSDLDRDGDQDLLSASSFNSKIAWYENISNPVPRVVSFTLVDDKTNNDVAQLDNQPVVILRDLNLKTFTVRANTLSRNEPIRRVEFTLDAPVGEDLTRSEYAPPYALFSDQNGDYFGQQAYGGNYLLTATPYYLDSTGAEVEGIRKTIEFVFEEPFPSISSFTLVNNNTDKDVQPLEEGNAVSLDALGSETFTVRADVSSEGEYIRRVEFQLSSPVEGDIIRSEYSPPYALFSDDRGDYFGRKAYAGDYTLSVTPYYLDAMGKETAGINNTISFTFTGGELPVVNSFTLVNNNTDEDIQPLEDGDQISLEDITTFTVRANVLPGQQRVRRVAFRLDAPAGQQGALRSEYATPYSLFSDNRGDYFGREAYTGEYKLTATPYYVNSAGKEIAGTDKTIRFTFTDSQGNLAASAGIAYPVPFNETLTLKLGTVDMAQTQIQLVHGYGKVYEMSASQMSQDAQGLVLNLAKLPSGPYTVRVMNAGQVQTFRVSKE